MVAASIGTAALAVVDERGEHHLPVDTMELNGEPRLGEKWRIAEAKESIAPDGLFAIDSAKLLGERPEKIVVGQHDGVGSPPRVGREKESHELTEDRLVPLIHRHGGIAVGDEFEPVFHGIEGYEQNVLGVESTLWTEWIDNTDLLAFRVFPRLTAVAESAWCDKSKKDYLAFENSLKNVNKLIENTTGIKAAPLKDCNVKNPLKRAAIMMKFGMNLIDFEMIARSNRAAKEMKKMRSVRKKENNGK